MTIKIRPSLITAHDECPYAAKLQYLLGVKSNSVSSNLVYGTAIHDAIAKYLLATASGMTFDPVAQFTLNWNEAINAKTIHYNSTMHEEDLREIGKIHCERFPAAWKASGLVPVVDDKGLLIERNLCYEILPGVILTGTPDIVAMNSDCEFVIPDFKTPASETPLEFIEVADALTAYQILVENNPSLGIPAIDRLGYMELLKKKVPKTPRGKGPVVCAPKLSSGRRSEKQIKEFTQKVEWIVDDIKRDRFPKRSRMAYNTPCTLCEYRGFCHEGDTEGLIFPKDALAKAA